MSRLDTLLEAARYIELQELRLLEEPKSPVRASVPAPRCNGASPPAPRAASLPVPEACDFAEHSRPRTASNSNGTPQIPSPPSVGSCSSNGSSNGSTPRAGTREVHNKLEKNRRAHLKECFELLKRQLPSTPDDKKTSNLSILGSAIRYIQVLRRKERECEHEMERLAREKIAAQQRLAALRRDATVLVARPRSGAETVLEDKMRDDRVNGQVLGIPISISAVPTSAVRMAASSPTRSINLSNKLRTLPIQITPTTSQVVRTTYAPRHNTLTLTTLAPADHAPTTQQNGYQVQNVQENGVTGTLSTTLMHPAQIHLPLSQVVGGGGLVVGGALQLLSAPGALRVFNGVTTEPSRISQEHGISTPPGTESNGVVVSGLTPLMVSSPSGHIFNSHTLTHKMMDTQMVKNSVAPLTVSAQYLSATTIVKPMVVVNGSGTPPSTSA